MSLISIANSRWGPTAAMWLIRVLPRRFTIWAVDRIAERIAGQPDSAMVNAIRSNQAVVQRLDQADPRLDRSIAAVLRNSMRSYITLFEAMDDGFEGLERVTEFDERLLEQADRLATAGRGMLYVGAHTMGLDHALIYLGGLNYRTKVLAYPEVMPSYQAQNRLRRSFGLNLSPVNYQSLREAITYLREGGIVVTAADRPDESGAFMEFFGLSAWLPVGHTRLSLKTGAPIMVGATRQLENGKYRAELLAIVEPGEFKGRSNAGVEMAQAVLKPLEAFIRERPEEWWMFHPVWPDGAGETSPELERERRQ